MEVRVSGATIAYLLDTSDPCPNTTQVYITHPAVTPALYVGDKAKSV